MPLPWFLWLPWFPWPLWFLWPPWLLHDSGYGQLWQWALCHSTEGLTTGESRKAAFLRYLLTAGTPDAKAKSRGMLRGRDPSQPLPQPLSLADNECIDKLGCRLLYLGTCSQTGRIKSENKILDAIASFYTVPSEPFSRQTGELPELRATEAHPDGSSLALSSQLLSLLVPPFFVSSASPS